MAIERYEVHGLKGYQLNIGEAIGDHHLFSGITSLHAGDFGLVQLLLPGLSSRQFFCGYRHGSGSAR